MKPVGSEKKKHFSLKEAKEFRQIRNGDRHAADGEAVPLHGRGTQVSASTAFRACLSGLPRPRRQLEWILEADKERREAHHETGVQP